MLGLHWRLRDFTLRPQAMDFRKPDLVDLPAVAPGFRLDLRSVRRRHLGRDVLDEWIEFARLAKRPLPVNYLPEHPFPHGHPQLRDEVAVDGVWDKRDERTIRNETGRLNA